MHKHKLVLSVVISMLLALLLANAAGAQEPVQEPIIEQHQPQFDNGIAEFRARYNYGWDRFRYLGPTAPWACVGCASDTPAPNWQTDYAPDGSSNWNPDWSWGWGNW